MGEDFAVELHDVVKRFGAVTAVNHVSLQIKDGEFFSLLGPSGCGKTTTLRLIAGFEMPTSGQIWIGGEPQGYLPAYKRPVNTVFQHYALFPHMTVTQNVAFGLEMKNIPKDETKDRVHEALELVHLGNLGNRRPKQLSGGQQQRVALARALVNKPKVLLLDEPLGALDLKLRKAMQVELKALQTRVGITFVYVTHDQEEALTMSDRIGVMDQGKLLQIGSAQDIYETPATRFVSDFIGQSNYLDGHVISVEKDLVNIEVEPGISVWAKSSMETHKGQQVTIAFRPEKVQLVQEAREGFNSITGVVKDIIYTGSTTSYNLETASGAIITVHQQNSPAALRCPLEPGAPATITWPYEASITFSD